MKKLIVIITIIISLAGCAREAKGPEPLNDEALKNLIVGKTLIVQNSQTGKLYEATYHANGQRVIRRMSEQQVRQSAARAFHGGSISTGTAPYEIRDSKIITTFDGVPFGVTVYKVEGKYVASRVGEGDARNWELVESRPAEVKGPVLSESLLNQRGIVPLDDQSLIKLIVGKTLIIRNLTTGELYEATYAADGKREVRNITEGRLRQDTYQSFHGGVVPPPVAPYKIRNSQVITTFNGETFTARVYSVEGKYMAARSSERGAVNWEVVKGN
jgi:hypothetical protein